MTVEDLKNLKLHETTGEDYLHIIRVPGGWIYYSWNCEKGQPNEVGTFVPESKEGYKSRDEEIRILKNDLEDYGEQVKESLTSAKIYQKLNNEYQAEIKKLRGALKRISTMNNMSALTSVTYAMDTAKEALKDGE